MTEIKLTGTSPTEYTAEIVKDDTTLVIINATATVVPFVPPVVIDPPPGDPLDPVDPPDPIDPPIDPPPVDVPPVDTTPIPPPPHGDITSDTVTLDVMFDGDPGFTQTAQKGQVVPLVAGDPTKGSLVYHADGLSTCIENCYAGTTGDITATFRLKAGNTILFDGPLTIYAGTRTRPFWLAQPKLKANPDLSAFPNYGPGSEAASMYAAYLKADNSPMGRGLASSVMGKTGEQDTLGPLPKWDACYIVNPTAQNAAVVRGQSDAMSVWGFHRRDFATGKMLSMVDFPGATMLGVYLGRTGNPIVKYTTANPSKLDSSASHAPASCPLACELFGTDYDREELSFWGNFCAGLYQNPGYRLTCGYNNVTHGQTRGKGRGLVVVLYAAKYSDNRGYFQAMLDAIPDNMNANWVAQAGLHTDQFQTIYGGSGGFAPWQMHVVEYSIGLALQLGYAKFQTVFDYMASPMIDSILTDHEFATSYTVQAKDASGSVVQDWAGVLQATAAHDPKVAAALAQPEDSQARMDALQRTDLSRAGDFIGYPTSPTGYAAMMQPALAMIADHGTDQVHAQAMWAKYIQWRRINFTKDPKYDVVPA